MKMKTTCICNDIMFFGGANVAFYAVINIFVKHADLKIKRLKSSVHV